MKNLFILFILIVMSACSSFSSKVVRVKKIPPRVTAKQYEIIKGEVKKVHYSLLKLINLEIKSFELECAGRKQGFDLLDFRLRAFIPFDYSSKEGQFHCDLSFVYDGVFYKQTILTFKERPYKYPTSKLHVPKKHVDLKPKDLKRWLHEQEILKKVYGGTILKRALFEEEFRRPLHSKVTAVYGSKRLFNNKKKSWHSGVDLRARRPTDIPAINRGKVVLVMDLFFNGKTVIVDHGLGIFSMYCHMSSYAVNEGDMVKKSDILGKTGNTGRSNAPHLHWGVRVGGSWVNGLAFLKQGI